MYFLVKNLGQSDGKVTEKDPILPLFESLGPQAPERWQVTALALSKTSLEVLDRARAVT